MRVNVSVGLRESKQELPKPLRNSTVMRTRSAMVLTEAVRTVPTACGCSGGCASSEDRRVNTPTFNVDIGTSMPVSLAKSRREEKQ
jgi:hypothetical protein